MLQRVSTPSNSERSLRSEDAFTIGVGAGVDFLLRSAFRMSYVFSESHLEFRTDDGDGSEQFDVEELGLLQRHVAAVEVVRYMFPARSLVTPYGSAGLAGAWWVLDESSALVTAGGGSSQFRLGALATFGLQVQLTPQSSARLEVATSSIRNPFTGSDSFRANGAVTIDEPTRVSQTDFRFAAVYYFAGPHRPRRSAAAAGR
jgi:opacity protein-like surface antigen